MRSTACSARIRTLPCGLVTYSLSGCVAFAVETRPTLIFRLGTAFAFYMRRWVWQMNRGRRMGAEKMIPALCLTLTGRIEPLPASKRAEAQPERCRMRRDNECRPNLSLVIDGCQRGDRECQHRLYEQFAPQLYRVIARIVGTCDADDVAQQAFLKIFGSIQKFVGRSRLMTWLHRIAVNEALQHLRRQKTIRVSALQMEPEARASRESELVQLRQVLEIAIAKLSPELRAAFILRETEGMSYTEISATLNLSDGTVASRISRARSELRGYLSELGWEP